MFLFSLRQARVISRGSDLINTSRKPGQDFVLAAFTLVPVGSVNGKCVFWVGFKCGSFDSV